MASKKSRIHTILVSTKLMRDLASLPVDTVRTMNLATKGLEVGMVCLLFEETTGVGRYARVVSLSSWYDVVVRLIPHPAFNA